MHFIIEKENVKSSWILASFAFLSALSKCHPKRAFPLFI